MGNREDIKREWLLFGKIFLFTVAIHWIVMYLSYTLLGISDNVGFFTAFYDKYIETGDTVHYLKIAENWYTASGEMANAIVFYPLYPFLMRALGFVIGDYFIAGVLISNVCTGVAGYYFYKLAEIEIGKSKAIDGLLIWLFFPFASFYIIVYTEGLSMMLVLMCLYYIKKEKWGFAGLAGMLAALSKSQGIALMVPAVYEAAMYIVKKKRFKPRVMLIGLIPAGTFVYLLINKVVQGDWFAFIGHQEAEPWYNKAKWISENISTQFGMAKDHFELSILIYWVQIVLYFVVIIALFYGLRKKISASLIAFGGAHLFISYLHGWLISGPRYVMGCVTMYIVFAVIPNKFVKSAILLACAALALFYTLGLWQGQAIM